MHCNKVAFHYHRKIEIRYIRLWIFPLLVHFYPQWLHETSVPHPPWLAILLFRHPSLWFLWCIAYLMFSATDGRYLWFYFQDQCLSASIHKIPIFAFLYEIICTPLHSIYSTPHRHAQTLGTFSSGLWKLPLLWLRHLPIPRQAEIRRVLYQNVIIHRHLKGWSQHSTDGMNGTVAFPIFLLCNLIRKQLCIGSFTLRIVFLPNASFARIPLLRIKSMYLSLVNRRPIRVDD